MKLTMRTIDALQCKPGKRDQLFFDTEQPGLAVRVMASGSKSFLAQFRANGLKRRVPLGSCSRISITDARKAVRGFVGDAARGIDAAAERQAARRKAAEGEMSLSNLIDQWRDLHLKSRRQSYASEAIRALRFSFKRHLHEPASALNRAAIVRNIDKLAQAGKSPMAGAVKRYGGACFSWAVRRGSIAANPFASLPAMPSASRERVLTDDELRAIWQATEQPGSFGGIVRALILTGARREEVAAMAWGEIDAKLTVWTLPAARAKNGKPSVTPLNRAMQALLRLQPRREGCELCFPGEKGPFSGYSKAKSRLDNASGVSGWTLHDLRRTVATGLQRLGVRLEVTESVLNHTSGSRAGVVGIYQKHDFAAEKLAALSAWGEHVAAVVEGRKPAENVMPLRRPA